MEVPISFIETLYNHPSDGVCLLLTLQKRTGFSKQRLYGNIPALRPSIDFVEADTLSQPDLPAKWTVKSCLSYTFKFIRVPLFFIILFSILSYFLQLLG